MGSALALEMRVLAMIGLAGCWANAQPAWTPPSTRAPAVAQCPIALSEDGHLRVWETDLGVLTTNPGTHQLAIYPLGDQALVALRDPDESRGPRGGDTLWRVSCDGKRLDTLTIAGADFGHAALHPDGRRLFYSAGGVMMLDLHSRTSTRITTPPPRACDTLANTVRPRIKAETDPPAPSRANREGPAPTVDTVRGATRDHVEFERGAPCGFELEWTATAMRRHLERGIEETAMPVTAVVSVDGAVWLAAGECGNAAVYRSTDWRTWQRIAVPDTSGRITLVADRAAGVVVLATGLCSGTNGVPARITRDGGKTWTAISKAVVEWVTGADLASLRAGAASGQLMWWKNDRLIAGSVEWAVLPGLPPPTTIDGRTVRPTLFGLYLGDERVFPPR